MHLNRLIALVAILLTLAGCTIVPGTHMSATSNWTGGHWFTGSDSSEKPDEVPLSNLVHTYPITTAVLQQQNLAPATSTEAQADDGTYEYIIGIGDILQVTVWDHPELTIPAGSWRSAAESGNRVRSDGTIFYPYVGKLKVAGEDIMTIRQQITDRLKHYIENPQVDVTVAAFKSQYVYVTGAVKKPGMVPISNIPLRLIDAVSAAGGLSDDANWRDVTLVRDHNSRHLSLKDIYQQGHLTQNLRLQDGDVINVGRSDDNKVFVLGEVVEAKILPITRNGMSLAEALTGAGGLDQMQADASGIFVMRKGTEDDKASIDVYQLNANNVAALVLADQFQLRPRDIVYVTDAPIARWNRLIQQIVPTVNAFYLGARGVNEYKQARDR